MKPRFLVVIMFLGLAFLGLFTSGLGSPSPVQAQGGTELLTNPDFLTNVSGWTVDNGDCFEPPFWYDAGGASWLQGSLHVSEDCANQFITVDQFGSVPYQYDGGSFTLDAYAYFPCSDVSLYFWYPDGSYSRTQSASTGFLQATYSGVFDLTTSVDFGVSIYTAESCGYGEAFISRVSLVAFDPTPTPTPTNTPEPTSTSTNTPEPTSTNTPEPFPTATPTITPTPTPSPGGGGTVVFFPSPGVLVIPLVILLFESERLIYLLYLLVCVVLLPSRGDGVAVGSLYWTLFGVARVVLGYFVRRRSK